MWMAVEAKEGKEAIQDTASRKLRKLVLLERLLLLEKKPLGLSVWKNYAWELWKFELSRIAEKDWDAFAPV